MIESIRELRNDAVKFEKMKTAKFSDLDWKTKGVGFHLDLLCEVVLASYLFDAQIY
jgi:hypothetical protein